MKKKVKGILFLAAVLLKCCHMDLYICRFPQLDGLHLDLNKLRLKLDSYDFLETQEDDCGSRVTGHKENAATQSNGLEFY